MKSYDEKKVNSVTAKMVIHMNIDDLKKLNPYYLVKNDDFSKVDPEKHKIIVKSRKRKN